LNLGDIFRARLRRCRNCGRVNARHVLGRTGQIVRACNAYCWARHIANTCAEQPWRDIMLSRLTPRVPKRFRQGPYR